MKRMIAIFLTLLLIATLLPASAAAEQVPSSALAAEPAQTDEPNPYDEALNYASAQSETEPPPETSDEAPAYPQTQLPTVEFKEPTEPVEIWDGTIATSYAGGTGTADDPYLISNGAQLAYLAQRVNAGSDYDFDSSVLHFKLTAHIYLNDTTDWESWGTEDADGNLIAPANEWTAIGMSNYLSNFKGTFDGNGYSVNGIYINKTRETDPTDEPTPTPSNPTEPSTSESYQGLFGYCENAAFANLAVKDSYIKGYDYVGGVIGCNDESSIVTNCYNTGTVSGNSSVGGVVGYNEWSSNVTNCYNTGTVSGNSSVGGVSGSGSPFNCYNTGTVSGTDYVGGISGSGDPFNCYNVGTVSGTGLSVGGAVGSGSPWDCYFLEGSGNDNGLGTSLSETEMQLESSFAGFDFRNFWAIEPATGYPYPQFMKDMDSSYGEPSAIWDGTIAEGFDSGSGTESDPYIIKTAEQLAYFASSVNLETSYYGQYIELVSNIELNDWNAKYWILNATPWTPIGTPYSYSFEGSFNGNGFAISGIYIDGLSYQGLFGYCHRATIANLVVKDSYIKGYQYVGGVVGYNHAGTVTDCYNAGTINGGYVGGVVGHSEDPSDVTNCYNTGTVTGNAAGGVVGGSHMYCRVIDCHNTGTVTGSSAGGIVSISNMFSIVIDCCNAGNINGGNQVGGVVGYTWYSEITNCYNTGTVRGIDNVGGVVGYNHDSSTVANCFNTGSVIGNSSAGGVVGYNFSIVTNCYNEGTVSGNGYVGGMVGWTEGGTVTNCYYLDACGASAGVGYNEHGVIANGIIPLTDEQMRVQENFTGFDFNYIWAIEPDTGYPYPQFMKDLDSSYGGVSAIWDGTIAEGFDSGSGTQNDPYIIKTAAQLAYLASSVNSGTTYSGQYIELVGDIELNDYNAKYWILNATPWTPIGTPYSYSFQGSFNGNGFAISGIYIDTINNYQGLFGYCDYGATISNLAVKDSYIRGDQDVGGIAGHNYGIITNCYNADTVSSIRDNVGGIVGYNYGIIANCYNAGTVSSIRDSVGGIVGHNYGTVTNCYNVGLISNTKGALGGVVGNNYGIVTTCYNAGTISSTGSRVGGVVGYGSASNCYNTGTVSGGSWVGGVAGDGSASNCYNTGTVSGSSSIGGVVGRNTGTVTNCYNTGTISGSSSIGGVVGYNFSGTVSNCYNTGTVSGNYSVGGVVGDNLWGSTVTNCYNTGTVSGTDYVGGVVGDNRRESTVTNCYYLDTCGASVGVGYNDNDSTITNVTPLTDAQLRVQSNYVGFDFDTVWTMNGNSDYPYAELIECLHGGNPALNPDIPTLTEGDYMYKLFNGEAIIVGYTGEATAIEIPAALGGAPVTAIGDGAFIANRTLVKVTIPDGVNGIGVSAFAHCSSLQEAILPNSLTSIGSYAFMGCTSLTEMEIPNGVSRIGLGAFRDCTSLTEIAIPNGVTLILNETFFDCYNLTSITIPSSVTSIGYDAFYNCYNLTIYCSGYSYAVQYAVENSIPFVITDEMPSEETYQYFDWDNSFYKVNYGAVSALGNLSLTSKYAFAEGANISDASITFAIPESVEYVEGSLIIDNLAADDSIITFNGSGTITIPLTENSGTIRFMIKPLTHAPTHSYAKVDFTADEKSLSYIIGAFFVELSTLTLEMPTTTSAATVTVHGVTVPNATVQLYVNYEWQKVVTANSAGDYTTQLTLPNPTDGKTYTIMARYEGEWEYTERVGTITFHSSTPNLSSFTLSFNGNNYNLLENGSPIITFIDGVRFGFNVGFDNADLSTIEQVKIVSTRSNVKKELIAEYDEETKLYSVKRFFDDENHSYVPGKLKMVCTYIINGTTYTLEYAVEDIRWAIDPSGYVYDAVTNERIAGVKATLYYKETEESEATLWDASEYSQQNPIYTDASGCYAWDVPEGLWQVKYEHEDYQTAYSEWLPVPPPQTEVNIAMTPIRSITGVEILTKPSKLSYMQNEEDLTTKGGVLKVSYSDNTAKEIAITEEMVEGFDNSTLGKLTLTVSYMGFEAEYEIEIIDSTPTYLYGDAECDGDIDAADAAAILRYVVKLPNSELSQLGMVQGDVVADFDGKPDAADAAAILRFVVKIITSFPIEAP
ncbi:MAG: GLUG motif-containing protein [Clostridia bacterium]|nr:GLUG motif-containing protein [Clostridia bacterium]